MGVALGTQNDNFEAKDVWGFALFQMNERRVLFVVYRAGEWQSLTSSGLVQPL